MKKIYNLLLVFGIPAIFLMMTSEMMYPTGSPGGKTGSPGDNGANCTDCHAGTPMNAEFWVYSPPLLTMGYSPNETYPVMVIGADENANRYGFECTVEDASGNKVGTMQAGNMGRTQAINSNTAVTHTLTGTTPLADTGTMWMFSWTAPPETVGPITFYAAINAANGDNTNNGDQIYLSQYTATPATSVFERTDNAALNIYPNPSNGIIRIDEAGLQGNELLSVYTLAGSRVYSTPMNGATTFDLSHLEKGIYVLHVGAYAQRLVIR